MGQYLPDEAKEEIDDEYLKMLEGLAVDYCLKKPVDLNYFMEIIDRILKIRLKHNLGIDDYHQTVLKRKFMIRL